MIFRKVLSSSGDLIAKKDLLTFSRVGMGPRGNHTKAVPPRTPLSTGEKVLFGSCLAASILCIPGWIVYHIPDYQKEDRNKYTGK